LAKSPGKARSSGGRRGGSAQATTDHEVIRRWVEERGGSPATVKGTERRGEAAGLLRIDFPGYSGAGKLEPISWEEFFEKFDEAKLEFLYQDKSANGRTSRFFKMVCKDDRMENSKGRGDSKSRGGSGRSSSRGRARNPR
jgi:hypothetical protein